MELLLKRDTFTDKSTIGKLYINGIFECDTLEDAVRAVKIPHITAIPAGRYEVALTYSNRFKKMMLELLNVPNYVGIRLHWGNKPEDTDGCPLTGQRITNSGITDFISNSMKAYTKMFAKVTKAIKTEKVFITIE